MRISTTLSAEQFVRFLLDFCKNNSEFTHCFITLTEENGNELVFHSFKLNELDYFHIPDNFCGTCELSPSFHHTVAMLPDNVVEQIALNSPIYPSTVLKAMLNDRELLSGRGEFFFTLTIDCKQNANSDATPVIEFEDNNLTRSIHNWDKSFRGAGIDAISVAAGRKLEYAFEPTPTIQDFLNSLTRNGISVTCADCGGAFLGAAPCISPECRERRKREKDDYANKIGSIRESLLTKVAAGELETWTEINAWIEGIDVHPSTIYGQPSDYCRNYRRSVVKAYWDSHPNERKPIDRQAQNYLDQAESLLNEAKKLQSDLDSLPSFSFFKGAKLAEQKDSLGVEIARITKEAHSIMKEREALLEQLKNIPK